MSKKQRVRGKGAEIFFSEEEEEQSEERSEDLVKKATFYFTQSQLDLSAVGLSAVVLPVTKADRHRQAQAGALEKAVFLLKQEHRIKTNKSEVMRHALEEFTSDFLQNRKDSALYERLAD